MVSLLLTPLQCRPITINIHYCANNHPKTTVYTHDLKNVYIKGSIIWSVNLPYLQSWDINTMRLSKCHLRKYSNYLTFDVNTGLSDNYELLSPVLILTLWTVPPGLVGSIFKKNWTNTRYNNYCFPVFSGYMKMCLYFYSWTTKGCSFSVYHNLEGRNNSMKYILLVNWRRKGKGEKSHLHILNEYSLFSCREEK